MLEKIEKYFRELSDHQREQYEIMKREYPEWNSKINVISRKDIDNLEEKHILHSLAIAKFIYFTSGSRVLDFGTGGGFPGIPLAVMFPKVHFHLVDRTGKKVRVAQEVAAACGLTNVTFQHGDVAECKERFDFVVSRAVMPQEDLLKICRKNISDEQRNALPNGLITLKGGELGEELKRLRDRSEVVEVSNYFDEDFFKGKKIVYTIRN
ncbi:MAG: 16S rRNA (guanine(527)-N(7))-methyltransferase RsmG [Lepagella sp.]